LRLVGRQNSEPGNLMIKVGSTGGKTKIKGKGKMAEKKKEENNTIVVGRPDPRGPGFDYRRRITEEEKEEVQVSRYNPDSPTTLDCRVKKGKRRPTRKKYLREGEFGGRGEGVFRAFQAICDQIDCYKKIKRRSRRENKGEAELGGA